MTIPTKTFINNFTLPVYGLGTWQMGGRWEPDTSKDEAEIEAIKAAIRSGITHLDTAESYGAGHSEELIGRAIKEFDREKLFIATKVAAANQGYDGVHAALDASLKRLGTDYVDLYLLHRYPEPGIDIEGTMKAMDELVESGKVKSIGVCNMSVNRLKEVQKHTRNQIVCNQVHYSLACREIVQTGVLEYCQQAGIAIVAWGPLQKGTLEQAEVLNEIATKHDKTPYQIALSWLMTQEGVVTIPKTSSIEHLKENLAVVGWTLPESDMEKLTKEFPGQYFKSDRVPLDYEADVEP
jgi:diketogulonate reductase-like aldo/keto reductase